jgi:hypothetical protein
MCRLSFPMLVAAGEHPSMELQSCGGASMQWSPRSQLCHEAGLLSQCWGSVRQLRLRMEGPSCLFSVFLSPRLLCNLLLRSFLFLPLCVILFCGLLPFVPVSAGTRDVSAT